MTDALTPDQMEAIKASVETVEQGIVEREEFLLRKALQWLDDGDWYKPVAHVWKRSYDGQKLTYYVTSNRLTLAEPLKKSSGRAYTRAFSRLFEIRYETADGFGSNVIHSMQRSPRIYTKLSEAIPQYWPSLLSEKEKRWSENIPPDRETLEKMVKWDEYNKMLRVYNPARDESEYVFDMFVELPNGVTYAVWRVLSMLQFGNPHGIGGKDEWKAVLDAHAPDTTPVLPPSMLSPRVIRRKNRVPRIHEDKPIDREASEKEQRFEAMAHTSRAEKRMEREAKAEARAIKRKAQRQAYYQKKKQEQAHMNKQQKAEDDARRKAETQARYEALVAEAKRKLAQ